MFKPPHRNERVAIELNIAGRSITADASVLYRHRSAEAPLREPGMAIKFIRIAPEDRAFIRKFIHDEVTRGLNVA